MVGSMASKGLRAITYQGTKKVEAGYNSTHTTKTLMAIPLVVRFVVYYYIVLLFIFSLIIFFIVIGVVNPFHKHFAIAYFAGKCFFQKCF